MDKIKFKHLSFPLKLIVIWSWIYVTIITLIIIGAIKYISSINVSNFLL